MLAGHRLKPEQLTGTLGHQLGAPDVAAQRPQVLLPCVIDDLLVAPAVDLKVLHAKIGELTLENDFLAGALSKAGLLSAKR